MADEPDGVNEALSSSTRVALTAGGMSRPGIGGDF